MPFIPSLASKMLPRACAIRNFSSTSFLRTSSCSGDNFGDTNLYKARIWYCRVGGESCAAAIVAFVIEFVAP